MLSLFDMTHVVILELNEPGLTAAILRQEEAD